jgi:DNA-binding response OmpR family regulator
MRLFFIDDDEWMKDFLRLLFEDEGCHLIALETAEEGAEESMKNGNPRIM